MELASGLQRTVPTRRLGRTSRGGRPPPADSGRTWAPPSSWRPSVAASWAYLRALGQSPREKATVGGQPAKVGVIARTLLSQGLSHPSKGSIPVSLIVRQEIALIDIVDHGCDIESPALYIVGQSRQILGLRPHPRFAALGRRAPRPASFTGALVGEIRRIVVAKALRIRSSSAFETRRPNAIITPTPGSSPMKLSVPE